MLDSESIIKLAMVCKGMNAIINADTYLFQQLIEKTYHLTINSAFLEGKALEKGFKHLSTSSVARYLHRSLASFNPAHLAYLRSTRLSLPTPFKSPSLLAFFIKPVLVFVNKMQHCSVLVSLTWMCGSREVSCIPLHSVLPILTFLWYSTATSWISTRVGSYSKELRTPFPSPSSPLMQWPSETLYPCIPFIVHNSFHSLLNLLLTYTPDMVTWRANNRAHYLSCSY